MDSQLIISCRILTSFCCVMSSEMFERRNSDDSCNSLLTISLKAWKKAMYQ